MLSSRSELGCRNLDKIRSIDIRKQLGLLSIHEGIRRNRQDWQQHVEGIKEGEVPKQVACLRPKGKRDPGKSH
jgi:hypothetical protein